jgi:heterodisulfide reductase subunit D
MERLKKYKNDIYKCIHCKACRFAYSGEPDKKGIGQFKNVLYEGMVPSCPAGIEYGWEAYWNAGKVWIARAILEGDLKVDQNVADVVYPCITCGMCEAQCENQVRTVDIIEALRQVVIDAGVQPMDKHALVKKVNAIENNPYGGKKADRMKWARDAGFGGNIGKDSKIGYYVGCTASYRQTNIATATMKLFQKLGYNVEIIDDESCCGSPFFRTGLLDEAQRTMNHNIERFNKFDVILFSCSGCYKTFTIDYPKWSKVEIKYKTMHAMELVSEMIKEGKLKLKEHPELKGKVATYHDPCHTGRHFGQWLKERLIHESENLMVDMRFFDKIVDEWFEIPRRIIKAIPGIEFKEMYRVKLNSFCCGAGGGVRSQFPDFSLRTSNLRLNEADAVGADFMLTECPFCWRNLYDANDMYKHKMKVMTILEMISTYELIESAEAIDIHNALRQNNVEKNLPSAQKKAKAAKK